MTKARNEEGEHAMRHCHDELTLDDLLTDPIITAMMHADGVDPSELESDLGRIAQEQREAAE
jgi:hypothetical protein